MTVGAGEVCRNLFGVGQTWQWALQCNGVALLPLLAGGLWWITASPRFIGAEYRNRWWENVVMALLFVLAIYGAIDSVVSIAQFLR